jgi:hypothetical protein
MLLQDLQENSITYLERFVNNGSPSGFTIKCSTSDLTSPFGKSEFINPFVCIANNDNFLNYGYIPKIDFDNCNDKQNWILIHPDMLDNPIFKSKDLKISEAKSVRLVPTASARTLQNIDSEYKGYFKLHYEGNIGRLNRDLTYPKAISGPEISKIIETLIDNSLLDDRLTHLPELGARVLKAIDENGKSVEWGMVWRDLKPYGKDTSKIKHIIPVFSLFAKDRNNINHRTLLEQIITEKYYDPTTYIIDYLINPIIECYFSLLCNSGIQAEWHAQNLLIGFDENFFPVKFITRDLESMDKDITLIENLKLPFIFESFPYKCIMENQDNYKIKHSFMFDFKLGEYIIQPLLNFLESVYFVSSQTLISSIKNCTARQLENLPSDFFPKNEWYVFENVMIDRTTDKRPYLKFPNPKFRP